MIHANNRIVSSTTAIRLPKYQIHTWAHQFAHRFSFYDRELNIRKLQIIKKKCVCGQTRLRGPQHSDDAVTINIHRFFFFWWFTWMHNNGLSHRADDRHSPRDIIRSHFWNSRFINDRRWIVDHGKSTQSPEFVKMFWDCDAIHRFYIYRWWSALGIFQVKNENRQNSIRSHECFLLAASHRLGQFSMWWIHLIISTLWMRGLSSHHTARKPCNFSHVRLPFSRASTRQKKEDK